MILDFLYFAAQHKEIAEDSTVYYARDWETRALYRFKYWGKQKDLVEKVLAKAMESVDSRRSPSISQVTQNPEGLWEGFLTYYGLGD